MTIEIAGTAAIRSNLIAWRVCMVETLVPVFLALAEREARAMVILRSAPRQAQVSIPRWPMATVFEREDTDWRA
jgi:hypothetical protein